MSGLENLASRLNYRRGSRQIDRMNDDKLKSVPVGTMNYKITKPTVLSLGGNYTATSMQALAKCMITARLLGLKDKQSDIDMATFDDVDIIGVSYGKCRYTEDTKMSSDELQHFCDTHLLPMVKNRKGNRLTLDEAKFNASMLTMDCHCYGANVADNLMWRLKEQMSSIGYNESEINEILLQITVVSFAPMNEIQCGAHLRVHSKLDMVIPEYAAYGPRNCNGIKVENREPNECVIWSSQLANDIPYDIGEHCISRLYRDGNWESTVNIASESKPKNYKYIGKNADAVSQIYSYVLSSMVATSIRNYHTHTFNPKPTSKDVECMANDILKGFSQEELMTK